MSSMFAPKGDIATFTGERTKEAQAKALAQQGVKYGVNPMKVYTVATHGLFRNIVATTSAAQAAKLIGVSGPVMRKYGGTTDLPHEVRIAMAEPGVVFRKNHSRKDSRHERVDPGESH